MIQLFVSILKLTSNLLTDTKVSAAKDIASGKKSDNICRRRAKYDETTYTCTEHIKYYNVYIICVYNQVFNFLMLLDINYFINNNNSNNEMEKVKREGKFFFPSWKVENSILYFVASHKLRVSVH